MQLSFGHVRSRFELPDIHLELTVADHATEENKATQKQSHHTYTVRIYSIYGIHIMAA